MSRQVKKVIWITWLIGLVATIVLVYLFDPPHIQGSFYPVIGLAILMIVVSLFYFQVKGTDIIALQGVSVAVFLIYGLFFEMVLTQISILTYLMSKQLNRDEFYRIPLNSLMFLLVSLCSAFAFYLIGGKTGVMLNQQAPDLLPILGYSFMVFFTNHVEIYFIQRFLRKTKPSFFGKDMLWEGIITALIMPVGIILFILYSLIGPVSILFITVPTITISVIFKLVNKSYEVNVLLQKSSAIGQQLTGKLDEKNIMALFLKKVPEMLDIEYLYIVSFQNPDEPKLLYFHSKDPSNQKLRGTYRQGISHHVYQTRKSFCVKDRKKWQHLSTGFLPTDIESVLSVPMIKENKIEAVITAASYRKKVYGKNETKMLEILANFLNVSIENAKNYQATKMESERCPLTNLYNYRYFMRLLNSTFEQETPGYFSIVMIDIDHFKKINDSFGHENGNVVLTGIADRLRSITNNFGTVARYGGEEFVVLLPDTDSSQCIEWAENLRLAISCEPFFIKLGSGKPPFTVNVTASIGVATAPVHASDALGLIRNADRAMYSGAKQKGRN
jgi:diguanylate cyclase (GGDEF)-like protein